MQRPSVPEAPPIPDPEGQKPPGRDLNQKQINQICKGTEVSKMPDAKLHKLTVLQAIKKGNVKGERDKVHLQTYLHIHVPCYAILTNTRVLEHAEHTSKPFRPRVRLHGRCKSAEEG